MKTTLHFFKPSVLPLAFAAASCALGPMTASAQQGTLQTEPMTADQMKAADERFMTSAASADQLIIMESDYAVEQVKNPRIQAIAKMLSDHHQKNFTLLGTYASKLGMEVSTALLPEDRAKLDAAMRIKGDEFATTYLFDMAACHFHHILCFAKAATGSHNEVVKEYAARSGPALREHYTALKGMAQTEAGITTDL